MENNYISNDWYEDVIYFPWTFSITSYKNRKEQEKEWIIQGIKQENDKDERSERKLEDKNEVEEEKRERKNERKKEEANHKE